ncbi:MAG: hypothetical protein ACYTBX_19505 [Planctomycetota bacterium]
MEEKKLKTTKALQLSQADVLKSVDTVVIGLTDESPGEGTDIVVVTWASNGESFAQHDPDAKDVNVFGIFKGVSSNEFLIERGSDRYGVSETAPQGRHLAEDSVSTCPTGVAGSLNSKGKRVWSQTTSNHGVINLGVVVVNVGYSNGAANEDELLDRLKDMAMDAHEEVFFEYSALGSDLDRLAYKTSGQAVDTWIAGFKQRAELELGASDRGEWSPPAVAFVNWVKSVADYRAILAIGNHVITMLGLETVPAPGSGYGYRDYSDTLVPLAVGDSAIGKEFFLESDNGKIGLRVLGCDYHTGECGIWFTYYDVDLTRVKIGQPCAFALAASSSRADMRMVRQVREFRDRYLSAFPRGQTYIDLFRRHRLETWRLVATDSKIRNQAKALIPKIAQLVKTWRETEPERLDQATIEGITNLMELSGNRASAQLRNSMDKVLPDLKKFQDLSLGEILLVLQEFDFPKK